MLPNANGKPSEPITGIVNMAVNGSHPNMKGLPDWTHWGDIVGIASHEFAGLGAEVYGLAAQIKEADKLLRADKTATQHRIILIAHSEGTAIADAALDLVNAQVRSEIDYYGNGPEAYISNNRGLHSAINFIAKGDPVPYMANDTIRIPRNILSGNLIFNIVEIPGHPLATSQFDNHYWYFTYGYLYHSFQK